MKYDENPLDYGDNGGYPLQAIDEMNEIYDKIAETCSEQRSLAEQEEIIEMLGIKENAPVTATQSDIDYINSLNAQRRLEKIIRIGLTATDSIRDIIARVKQQRHSARDQQLAYTAQR